LEREWIRDACEEAGLSVLRLMNDSTASGLCYGIESGLTKESKETVLASLSWGAGVCSCSLINMEGGIVEVMGTGGDALIGGEEFTQRLVQHCREEIRRDYSRDVLDPLALRRLRLACDQAKVELSTYTSAVIQLRDLADGIDFRTRITRDRFEILCAQDFTRCLTPIQQALAHAKITTEQVEQVVLVGGSTRIPKVQQIIKQIFGPNLKNLNVDRDETVAFGTAIYCSMTGKPDSNSFTDDLLLMDCNPYSLGVNVGTKEGMGEDGKVVGIVERNINIPLRKSAIFTTVKDNQDNIVFRIYEGENSESSRDWFLGEVHLSNLRPGPAGSIRISLTFDIDANEILTVTAEELGTGNKTTQNHKFSSSHSKNTKAQQCRYQGHKKETHMETEKDVEKMENITGMGKSMMEKSETNKKQETTQRI
jgi:L1 cell adhesion molecule like protein